MRALAVIYLMLLASWPPLTGQEVITARRRVVSGGVTPMPVQSVANSSACNFGACGPVTLPGAATSGNKIIVELINQDSASTNSCVDNLSHTLTEQSGSPQAGISAAGGGYWLHELAYVVPGSGVTTITCSFTGSFAEMWVIEAHGTSGTTMQAASTSAYTFGNCSPSPSATPTSSPSLAFGVYWADVLSPSPGTGWTAIGTVSTNGSPLWLEYKAFTGTSPVSATATVGCSSHGPDAYINIW